MKKLIYILTVLGLLFTGCNPMDDIHAEIDALENPVVGDAVYTLSAEDYTALNLNFGSFSSPDDAKAMLPDFLSELYPIWGKGSSALVGYKLYVGNAPGVSDYTGAAVYNLNLADYALSGSDVLGFYPDVTPSDYVADILAANITAPSEGQISLVKYTQYTEVPVVVSSKIYFEENFDFGTTAGDLTTINGDWTAHANIGSGLAGYATSGLSMANYPTSAIGGSLTIAGSGSEDVNHTFSAITSGKVYASALINLSAVGTGTYFFHFMDDAFGYSARVGAKDDGSGKILFGIGASSSTLTYGATAYDLNTTYLLVSSYDIASGVSNLYVLTTAVTAEPGTPEATSTQNPGLGIQKIGVRQGGGGPTATIDGIRVASSWTSIMSNEVIEDVVTGKKVADKKFYTNTGGVWKEATNGVYLLVAADFDSMGEAAGQPGQFNNFSSSIAPDNYLPTFLNLKYPFALEGDELFVIYDYFSSSSGAQLRGNLYTKTNGVWVGFKSTIDTTLQFGHDGNTWVPDNTIKYEFVTADYDFIVATFTGVDGYATAVANLSSFKNISTFNWTPVQFDAAVNAVLKHNFPGMAEGQKFAATIFIYDGSSHNTTINYILTSGVYVRN